MKTNINYDKNKYYLFIDKGSSRLSYQVDLHEHSFSSWELGYCVYIFDEDKFESGVGCLPDISKRKFIHLSSLGSHHYHMFKYCELGKVVDGILVLEFDSMKELRKNLDKLLILRELK